MTLAGAIVRMGGALAVIVFTAFAVHAETANAAAPHEDTPRVQDIKSPTDQPKAGTEDRRGEIDNLLSQLQNVGGLRGLVAAMPPEAVEFRQHLQFWALPR